jgi:L,D-peptidoglycan transpeptidase YkuD (ErfK/YbiS/YcfS/YnhG family)
VGAIRAEWGATGYENGRLGYPITNEVCGLTGGGCYQMFEGGAINWSPAAGAHLSAGGIRAVWAGQGFESGWLGYPTTDEVCSGTDCVQKYQGGVISWRNGVVRTYGYNECDTLNDSRSVYSGQGARNVTFAVAEAYGRSDAWIIRCMGIAGVYVTDWATEGTVGRSGFKPPGVPSGPTRYEYSPTGSYSFTDAFGLGNPGTALNYITLSPGSRWGGNPWTPTYNTYFESSSWVGYDENMWYFANRSTHDYRQGAVINYNRPPDSGIVQDAGFAIFLHENPAPTAGCVAVPEWAMVDWLQKAAPGDRMIMGVRADLFR